MAPRILPNTYEMLDKYLLNNEVTDAIMNGWIDGWVDEGGKANLFSLLIHDHTGSQLNLVNNSHLSTIRNLFFTHDSKGLTLGLPSALLIHQSQQRTHVEFFPEELIVIGHSPVNLLFQFVHRQGWVLPVGAWGPGQKWHTLGLCRAEKVKVIQMLWGCSSLFGD